MDDGAVRLAAAMLHRTRPGRFPTVSSARVFVDLMLVDGIQGIKEITAMAGGRSAKPKAPVIVGNGLQRGGVVLIGGGVTEAAELEDMALEQAEAKPQTKDEYMRAFRERHGLAPFETFAERLRANSEARIAYHKAHPVTDHNGKAGVI